MIDNRIKKLIRVSGMNLTSFSSIVGVNVTVIFNIVKGRKSKPSFDLILKILKAYDGLSSDWLMKGKGPMWNDATIVASEDIMPTHIKLNERIRELFARMRLQESSDSIDISELEELVRYLMEESTEQKSKLIVLHERQEGMLEVLKEKLKFKNRN